MWGWVFFLKVSPIYGIKQPIPMIAAIIPNMVFMSMAKIKSAPANVLFAGADQFKIMLPDKRSQAIRPVHSITGFYVKGCIKLV